MKKSVKLEQPKQKTKIQNTHGHYYYRSSLVSGASSKCTHSSKFNSQALKLDDLTPIRNTFLSSGNSMLDFRDHYKPVVVVEKASCIQEDSGIPMEFVSESPKHSIGGYEDVKNHYFTPSSASGMKISPIASHEKLRLKKPSVYKNLNATTKKKNANKSS